jgi:hypothetical protein
VDKGDTGFDYRFGHGLADAYSAVEAALGNQCFVATPVRPTGDSYGVPGSSYTYTAEEDSCLQGHGLEYRFEWGDDSDSAWSSNSSAEKAWDLTGEYQVRVQARCTYDPTVISAWSPARIVTISESLVYIPGDANGDGNINVGDAILVLRSIVGLAQLDANQDSAADVNKDGKVNVSDAILILRYIVGLISEFPVN